MADVRDIRPKFASDHESNRIKVCAPCGKKLTVNQVRKITCSCCLTGKDVTILVDLHFSHTVMEVLAFFTGSLLGKTATSADP